MDPRSRPRKHHEPNALWRARRMAGVKAADACEFVPCDDCALWRRERLTELENVPWAMFLRLAILYERARPGVGRWLMHQHPAVQEWIRMGAAAAGDPRPAA